MKDRNNLKATKRGTNNCLEAIQQQKSKAISEVRSLFLKEIAAAIKAYSEVIEWIEGGKVGMDAESAMKKDNFLMSALKMGYLALEGRRMGLLGMTDKELLPKDDQHMPLYNGLSFVDVRQHVNGMVDLDNLGFIRYIKGDNSASTVAKTLRLHALNNFLRQAYILEGLNPERWAFRRRWPNSPTLKQKFAALIEKLEDTDWSLHLEDHPS